MERPEGGWTGAATAGRPYQVMDRGGHGGARPYQGMDRGGREHSKAMAVGHQVAVMAFRLWSEAEWEKACWGIESLI